LPTRAIHDELITVLGQDVSVYATVTKYVAQQSFHSISAVPSDAPLTIMIDDVILDALDKHPFQLLLYIST
jgi:hypothetical protein